MVLGVDSVLDAILNHVINDGGSGDDVRSWTLRIRGEREEKGGREGRERGGEKDGRKKKKKK